MAQFKEVFGGDQVAFRNSTAAMRVNGYLSGNGTRSQLDGEIEALGLDDAAKVHLASLVVETTASAGCPVP